MLAVRLFMPPVPRRAISPKQTPGPRVTKMMLSLGPPTTLSNDKTELQNHKSTNAHLDRSWGHDEHLHPDVALLADVVPGQEDNRLQLAHDRLGTVLVLRKKTQKKEETFFASGWLKSYGHFGQHLPHQNYLTNTWLLLLSCFANLTRRENVKIILLFYVCKFCIYV